MWIFDLVQWKFFRVWALHHLELGGCISKHIERTVFKRQRSSCISLTIRRFNSCLNFAGATFFKAVVSDQGNISTTFDAREFGLCLVRVASEFNPSLSGVCAAYLWSVRGIGYRIHAWGGFARVAMGLIQGCTGLIVLAWHGICFTACKYGSAVQLRIGFMVAQLFWLAL